MTKRKQKQKTKKKLCTMAEAIESEAKQLIETANAANRKEWQQSVKLAGGAENMRLNRKPPKAHKKPPKAFKTTDRAPWVTLVEIQQGKGGTLVKLNRVSFRQGLQSNLPSLGFTYTLGKWSKLK